MTMSHRGPILLFVQRPSGPTGSAMSADWFAYNSMILQSSPLSIDVGRSTRKPVWIRAKDSCLEQLVLWMHRFSFSPRDDWPDRGGESEREEGGCCDGPDHGGEPEWEDGGMTDLIAEENPSGKEEDVVTDLIAEENPSGKTEGWLTWSRRRIRAGRRRMLWRTWSRRRTRVGRRRDDRPDRVGESEQEDGEEMMEDHDDRVLPPPVHVDRRVDRVYVEGELERIHNVDVGRHISQRTPVWRQWS